MLLPEKVFTFYSGLQKQRTFEVSLGWMPSAFPNLSQIKLKETYWCYFLALVSVLPSPLKIFLPTPLVYSSQWHQQISIFSLNLISIKLMISKHYEFKPTKIFKIEIW